MDLLLRSLRFSVSQNNLRVLYTCDPEYEGAYERLKNLHPDAEFIRETDFRPQVIDNISDEYLVCLVDDDVMIDDFSEDSPELLEFQRNEDIICVNLRMSQNYDFDYLANKPVPIPEFSGGTWEWRKYRHDWGYPMSVSAHIFRKDDISSVIESINFDNPSTLEQYLQGKLNKPLMIGFEKGKFINIPVNRVGKVANRVVGDVMTSTSFLNDKFMAGYIIDIVPIINKAKKTRAYFMPVAFEWIKT